MKNVVLTVAALLVAALVAWPTAAGVAPSASPSPEVAPAGTQAPEAPAPELSTLPAPETPSGDLQLEPIAAASGGDCNCLDVWDPVCGSNGVTYSNACYAECDGVLNYTEGSCGSTS